MSNITETIYHANFVTTDVWDYVLCLVIFQRRFSHSTIQNIYLSKKVKSKRLSKMVLLCKTFLPFFSICMEQIKIF